MQDDMAERRPILQTLFDVYDFDTNLENDMPVMSSKVPAILVWYTTQEERRMVAKWVREAFDLDIDWHAHDVGEFYETFEVLLMGLEADSIDDETFLHLSREMENYHIRPAQQILSVNPALYRRQVADAFQRDTPRITQELLTVKQAADKLAQQGDALGAATIYETLVTEIFEQSHLCYDEARFDDYYSAKSSRSWNCGLKERQHETATLARRRPETQIH
jgi:hypothetical protein